MKIDNNHGEATGWSLFLTYWLSRTTIALAAVFIIAFISITYYVSRLQEDLNHTAAIERAANLSEAVAAQLVSPTSQLVSKKKPRQ